MSEEETQRRKDAKTQGRSSSFRPGAFALDLRFAWRMLTKNPGFTGIAVLTLALGIGANTAIFSVVNGVLLKPLPYPEPDRLVRLYEKVSGDGVASDRMEIAPANYLDWRAQAHSFAGIAAWGYGMAPLAGAGETQQVASAFVSANFFSVLGVQPIYGRVFTTEEDEPGRDTVALLSYALWQRLFAGDLRALGQSIKLDGQSYTVIGIMPAGFQYPREAVVWTPLSLNANQVRMREAHFLKVIARLDGQTTASQARAEMETIARRLSDEHPETNRNWSVALVPLLESEVGRVKPALLLLLAAVGLVVLIACTNMANLLLARAATREKEIAVRAALGASRGRIIWQLLTESALLGLIGGAVGLLVAWWATDALVALTAGRLPRTAEITVDRVVLGFAFALSLLTGLACGLVPALHASRDKLMRALKDAGRAQSSGRGRLRLLDLLIVVEIALALVVLIGSGLMLHSFFKLRGVDTGIETHRALALEINLPSTRYSQADSRAQRLNFYRQVVERVEALPGVEAAGAVDSLPLGGEQRVWSFRYDSRPDVEPALRPAAGFQVATTNYFRAAGLRAVRGRLFTEADQDGTLPVMLIDQAFAGRFFPNEDPIGKRLIIRNQTEAREIVGIVNDVRHFGADRAPAPQMYVPYNQMAIGAIPLVVRTKIDPAQLIGAVKNAVQSVDGEVAVSRVRTMQEVLASSQGERRFTLFLIVIFAVVAVALATIGIYGVMSYGVTERTREIGIRRALGAQTIDILRLTLGHGLRLAAAGGAIGLLAAVALTRLMKSLLFEVSAIDPISYALTTALLVVAALAACYVPARRATQVDPLVALRHE